VEQELVAGLGERQVAELVQDDEVHAREIVGHAALAAGTALGLELVDQVDDVEEAAAGAVADAGSGDGDGQVGLAGAGPADQNDVALLDQEPAAGEIVHEGGVDRRAVEGEVAEVLGQRQPGDRHLVLDRARLLLGDLGLEQVADDPLRLVLALDRGGDDFVVSRLHAEQLQPAPCRLGRHPSGDRCAIVSRICERSIKQSS
jgi:hypothetical protein